MALTEPAPIPELSLLNSTRSGPGSRPIRCSTRASTKTCVDLYGGQLDFATLDPTAAFEPIRTGKLKALAVTSATRLGSFPDVPTMQEAGIPDYDISPWIGLVVPAGTPQPIIDKLAAWHRQINSTEDAKKTLLQFGMDPLDGDGAAMTALLKRDIVRWGEFAKLAKIEPQ